MEIADERLKMFKGTTILCVRRGREVAMAGDGQVSLGNTVMKHTARKLRRMYDEQVIAGFAGSTADALRYEKVTGNTVSGKRHAIKARERVQNLKSWIKNNPSASSSDKSASEQMLLDLMEALGDI